MSGCCNNYCCSGVVVNCAPPDTTSILITEEIDAVNIPTPPAPVQFPKIAVNKTTSQRFLWDPSVMSWSELV